MKNKLVENRPDTLIQMFENIFYLLKVNSDQLLLLLLFVHR